MINPLTVDPVTNKPWEYPVYPANYPCPLCLHAVAHHGYNCCYRNVLASPLLCQCTVPAKKLARGAKKWAKKMNRLLAKQNKELARQFLEATQSTVDDLKRLESELKA